MTQIRSTTSLSILFAAVLLGSGACTGEVDSGDLERGSEGSGGLIAGEDNQGTGARDQTGGSGNGGTGEGELATGGQSPGTGGGNGDPQEERSSGCGATPHPMSGDHTIMVNGKSRKYTLLLPDNYDPNTAYPITFGLHWRGGNSGHVVSNNYYGLKDKAAGSMIFVSPDGLVADGTTGWANAGGEDVEFVALMLDRFESELCVDRSRVFATGFSYGGMFSNAIGCALADRFTAIAPYSGSLWSGCAEGSTPIAYLGTHGTADLTVEIPFGRTARDEFLERNGCTGETTPYGENGCVAYSGCEQPVVWCEYNDGHWWPGFATDEVWNFFSQF